ncbi:hypothetical protein Scep_022184 [Stephania cephalantha]|uniref:Uncharacterized protein n=1 Tax=Stephania cephalantha TaxID=152367 RepID=A0AAP0F4W3_9MAGN
MVLRNVEDLESTQNEAQEMDSKYVKAEKTFGLGTFLGAFLGGSTVAPWHEHGWALAHSLAHSLAGAQWRFGTGLGTSTVADLGREHGAPWQVPLARARSRLGRFLWHEQGRALARARSRLGMSKVAPWHGQGIPWQRLTKLDLGVEQVKVRLVSFLDVSYWSSGNGLTSTIRRGDSPRGGMGKGARKTLEHALGSMPRQDPWTDHSVGHPEPVGLGSDRAPTSTQGALEHS